jgi:hypothetical protein
MNFRQLSLLGRLARSAWNEFPTSPSKLSEKTSLHSVAIKASSLVRSRSVCNVFQFCVTSISSMFFIKHLPAMFCPEDENCDRFFNNACRFLSMVFHTAYTHRDVYVTEKLRGSGGGYTGIVHSKKLHWTGRPRFDSRQGRECHTSQYSLLSMACQAWG